jgi:hypothetical protein
MDVEDEFLALEEVENLEMVKKENVRSMALVEGTPIFNGIHSKVMEILGTFSFFAFFSFLFKKKKTPLRQQGEAAHFGESMSGWRLLLQLYRE